jgi:hypothetical protein
MKMKNGLPEVSYFESLVGSVKTNKLIELLKSSNHLTGDVCEVGVYKGGTAKLIVDYAVNCDIFLFDTFEGMPYFDKDFDKDWEIGTFDNTNYEKLCELFIENNNVKVYKCIFPKENSEIIETNKFKFVHLDVDNYQSYKECLHFFYDKMVIGGTMVFDDYDEVCCPGANKAVDEFFQNKKETLQKNFSTYIIKE